MIKGANINMVRKHVIFKGRVQGVGFRYYCRIIADRMRLTGWVRNLYNGDVEMEIQGDKRDIEMYLYQIKQCDRFIRIDDIEVTTKDVIEESQFYIKSY